MPDQRNDTYIWRKWKNTLLIFLSTGRLSLHVRNIRGSHASQHGLPGTQNRTSAASMFRNSLPVRGVETNRSSVGVVLIGRQLVFDTRWSPASGAHARHNNQLLWSREAEG